MQGGRLKNTMPEITVSPLAFVFAAILFIDGTIYALITFAAAAVHELGHLAAALIVRAPISRISLWPLGAVITLGEPCSYRADIAVKLAGGSANLLAAAVCQTVRQACPLSEAADVAAVFFILCNIALAAFNLLPIRTLDGGEALYSLLCLWLEPDSADNVMSAVSFIAIFPLWIIAGFTLFYTGGNFTLMLMVFWLFFAAVLQSG